MSKRKLSSILIALGGALLLAALLLFGYNCWQDARAAQNAQDVMNALQEELLKNHLPHRNPYDDDMQEMELYGNDYIGYLSIPALGLNLPIIDDWSYPKLKVAPCRQFGSIQTDDLVIAGHNYRRQFGHLHNLHIGDMLQFTDMDGVVTSYKIGEVNRIKANDTNRVKNSDWDLVLYTCNYLRSGRTMVGAARITEKTETIENR